MTPNLHRLYHLCKSHIAHCYEEPHRHYHTLSHIRNLMNLMRVMEERFTSPEAVLIAIWFHDAVYDTRRTDNEERSVDLAKEFIALHSLSEVSIQLVTDLILSTKKHQPLTDHPDIPYFLDMDLRVLGQEVKWYDQYAADIRKEYEWVDESSYRAERIKVLNSFLSRSDLYFTPDYHVFLEKRARSNIEREIQSLSQTPA